jgi:hypothetical protein
MVNMRRAMEAAEQERMTQTFDATVSSYLQPGESVRAWVFGRTWPNSAARTATHAVMGWGAIGGALYGYMIGKRTTARYLVATDRRVLSLVVGPDTANLDWEAARDEVTVTAAPRIPLTSGDLVLRRTTTGAETRINVAATARRHAQALVSVSEQHSEASLP